MKTVEGERGPEEVREDQKRWARRQASRQFGASADLFRHKRDN